MTTETNKTKYFYTIDHILKLVKPMQLIVPISEATDHMEKVKGIRERVYKLRDKMMNIGIDDTGKRPDGFIPLISLLQNLIVELSAPKLWDVSNDACLVNYNVLSPFGIQWLNTVYEKISFYESFNSIPLDTSWYDNITVFQKLIEELQSYEPQI